uniref:Galactose-3-O-sulfotransferase 1a n=1 Tax=Cynoglossus semilaevis TaxID=244447 RepID=A0A3P8VXW3_CYNSE
MTGKQERKWRSMAKGLVLSTFLTSCMILVSPLHRSISVCLSKTKNTLFQISILSNLWVFYCLFFCALFLKGSIDVMFMKTHKTASSTFINTLFRFGEKHRLKFAFPDSGNDFFYPSLFECFHLKDYRPGMCFNIILVKVLPMDTSYITILIPSDDKLTYFYRFNSFYLKNLLFFDFGQDNNLNLDDPCVEEGMQLIFDRFQLVMLAEYLKNNSSYSRIPSAGRWMICSSSSSMCARDPVYPNLPLTDGQRDGIHLNVDKAHQKTCRKMLMPEIQYLTELGVNLLITKLWGHVREIINW